MTEMTIGQWNQANRHMIWSIYNYKDWERIDQDTFTSEEEARRAYETVRLDLAAPDGLPDGSYTLVCHGFNNRRGRADGALIRQGKCDPDSFDQAAYTALCRAYNIDPDHPPPEGFQPHHCYIESLTWDPDARVIQVSLGS